MGGALEYKIQLLWDNEASVWIAISLDVPGLVLESGSFDTLIERVRYAIPELLETNRQRRHEAMRNSFSAWMKRLLCRNK